MHRRQIVMQLRYDGAVDHNMTNLSIASLVQVVCYMYLYILMMCVLFHQYLNFAVMPLCVCEQHPTALCPPEYMVCFLHRLITAVRTCWDNSHRKNPGSLCSDGMMHQIHLQDAQEDALLFSSGHGQVMSLKSCSLYSSRGLYPSPAILQRQGGLLRLAETGGSAVPPEENTQRLVLSQSSEKKAVCGAMPAVVSYLTLLSSTRGQSFRI